MTARTPWTTGLIILSILLISAAGCAPRSTPIAAPPTAMPTPTVQPGWERHSASTDQGQCGYAIDHPAEMDPASQGAYSWTVNTEAADPTGLVPNFVYVSVIPDDLPQSGNEPGAIYNYDPADTQRLLSMQVGESLPLHEEPTTAPWFTYTRLPDVTVGGQTARVYENNQPWEFPLGTKEIRYYLQANGCTYLVGGYLSTVGSGQPGAMDEDLFDQIIATFRVAS